MNGILDLEERLRNSHYGEIIEANGERYINLSLTGEPGWVIIQEPRRRADSYLDYWQGKSVEEQAPRAPRRVRAGAGDILGA